MKLRFKILISVLLIPGCVWPGIDNRKQGPLDNRIIPTAIMPTLVAQNNNPPPAPDAVMVNVNSGSTGTATVTWMPVDWGRPVSYFIGWGTSPGSYTSIANTSQTSFQVTGLKYNTLYYFDVKTIDSLGLQSDWGKWWHYAPPKPTGPKPSTAGSPSPPQ